MKNSFDCIENKNWDEFVNKLISAQKKLYPVDNFHLVPESMCLPMLIKSKLTTILRQKIYYTTSIFFCTLRYFQTLDIGFFFKY